MSEDAFQRALQDHYDQRTGHGNDEADTKYSRWAAKVRAEWMAARGIKPRSEP